ncbi:START domain protein [Dictyocaulus viviparus]|uniref:Phosphatidylcholine transfer protein n=1 Tax=Dictyocaulus viviparus TaxID=29172 RepID=A0A0D8Y6B8_DICVI|nr:START domain protein [Dictyocaulus viviparus]
MQIIKKSSLRRQIFQHGSRSRHYHYQSGDKWWLNKRVLLAFTSTAGFSFAEHGVKTERLDKALLDEEFDEEGSNESDWEILVEEENLKVYRRLTDDESGIYEYKCIGTYYDISASLFLDVQNDLSYRREWDSNVMDLELLKEEDEHELIRWVQKYPYPLYPREYIYTRKTWISDDFRMLVVDSEIVPTHLFPGDSKNIRVRTYKSRMAVRSHNEFEDHGLDYVLTYFDNPEANIARPLYNWLVNRGGPYFLKQVHEVAREAEETGRCLKWTSNKFERMRLSKERQSSMTCTSTTVNLLDGTERDSEKVDESELEDPLPMTTKARKFTFSSLDSVPLEIHVTA